MLTLQQHAKKALAVQDACNAHGVAVAFVSWLDDYSKLHPSYSTDEKNQHPVTVAYVDKLASLAGCQALGNEAAMAAFSILTELAKGDDDV